MARKEAYDDEKIRSMVSYDPATGLFTRLIATNNRVKVGEICGFVDYDGYRRISLGKLRLAHRLAWFFMTGSWPDDEIDHINGNRDDNRWCNLRPAGRFENAWNMKSGKPNSSGYRGVNLNKNSGRWESAITANRVRYHLGTFDTPELAHAAYREAQDRLHGEFAKVA